ncbi:MAG TPA: ROK family protein [Actinoplanes sp.]|nr:ROK family protein [Actinoplanes sp.]
MPSDVSGVPALLDLRVTALSAVLDLVRSGRAATRPEIERHTGLGRKLIAQRVDELVAAGLLAEGAFGPSTGGRAPRQLQFVADAGHLLVAHYGATRVGAALADLTGKVIDLVDREHPIADGPEPALDAVFELWDTMLKRRPADRPLWGAGIGVPGPVEFSTARLVSPPIMPGWHGFGIREKIQRRYGIPSWVDNDVNAMALGELRAGEAQGAGDFIYLKIGSGIGAGLVTRGALHRGAQGVAGDVGHTTTREPWGVTCRCGKTDCLEAVAGGAALVKDVAAAVARGESPVLADRGDLTVDDLRYAAEHGDRVTTELLSRSGRLVGEMLAGVVNLFNPSLIIIGGHVAEAGDSVLAAVRQAIYDQSLPLATRDLRIVRSMRSDMVGVTGSAFTAIDELFRPANLAAWIDLGSPAGLHANP